jgi:hypothetical protein
MGVLRLRKNFAPNEQGLSFLGGRGRSYNRAADRNDRTLGRISGRPSPRQHFLLDGFHEILDLILHFFHALAHLQDDGDAADVHAEIARQVQNEFQPLQVFVGVEASVAFGT